MLTRDDHGLTAHNKDDLHRTELLKSELSALANGEPQLDDENTREETDAGSDGDIGSTLKPDKGTKV